MKKICMVRFSRLGYNCVHVSFNEAAIIISLNKKNIWYNKLEICNNNFLFDWVFGFMGDDQKTGKISANPPPKICQKNFYTETEIPHPPQQGGIWKIMGKGISFVIDFFDFLYKDFFQRWRELKFGENCLFVNNSKDCFWQTLFFWNII